MTEPMASVEMARDQEWMGGPYRRLRPAPAAAGADLTVIVLAYFWTPTDPDVWWHLRDGQMIVQTGHVPTTALYTYTVPGTRWMPMNG